MELIALVLVLWLLWKLGTRDRPLPELPDDPPAPPRARGLLAWVDRHPWWTLIILGSLLDNHHATHIHHMIERDDCPHEDDC